jgi:hypothetical protein
VTGRVLVAAAFLLALGLGLSGWFVGRGLVRVRTADRYVSVKGVSEREVEADLALWPFRISATSNDLGSAQAGIDRSTRLIMAFLARHGIDTSQVESRGLEVTDLLAERYRGEGAITSRFIVQQTIMVRSTAPRVIQAAAQRMGELVEAGVVFSGGEGYGPVRPTFLFKSLNEIKPEMIAEATANARVAAEQFAADSRSRLGGIRQANQGTFVILPRDQAPGIQEESQLHKTLRVVATVEYYLQH